MTNNTEALVTVSVITYNSSKFILDTLNSIKNQTYKNIELIISDDCSKDNTVEIAKEWLKINKERFTNSELITSTINTGVSENKKRAISKAKGEWLKSIAGDDILLENCILDNINFVKDNPNTKIICSNIKYFSVIDGQLKILKTFSNKWTFFLNEHANPDIQHKSFLVKYYINSGSLFMNMNIFKTVKYDGKYKLIEDYPFALNLTKAGICFRYMDSFTVMYRIHDNSINASYSNKKIFNNAHKNNRQFTIDYIYPNISFIDKTLREIEYYRKIVLDKLGLNRNIMICRLINSASHFLSPYQYLAKFQIMQLKKKHFNQ